MDQHGDIDWIQSQPIAHRGLHSTSVPENSIAACQRAITEGYAIELDVRLSADNTPVVFHDETLSRLTETTGTVANHTWDELQDLRLAGTDKRIPRLQDVLELVDGAEPLCIEIKNDDRPGELEAAVIGVLDNYDGPLAVQSFNPLSLGYIRTHRPRWPRGQLSGSFSQVDGLAYYEKFTLERLAANIHSRPQFIGYRCTDLPYWPVTAHQKLGLPILAWTVQTPAELQHARNHADNVIFEEIRL